ncbi:hypothetical protein FRB91_007913, partial [Serendipita sp. 411]
MATPRHKSTLISASSTYSLFQLSFYNITSSRIQKIQAEMTHRALELMSLPPDESLFLLDIGCGSGLSGEILDEMGHLWVGVDIAPSML